MRIKFIIPFPFDDEGLANRAAQVPREILGPDTDVECVSVRNSPTIVTDYYESMLFDMYIAEAAFRAEEEGYDAVIMDTVSDSGLYAIRSRLNILAIGPGLISYAVAIMLGKRFSIVTMWDKWRHLYEKNLDTYHLWEKCASIRAVNIPPDVEQLFTGKEEEMFEKLTGEARAAIEQDGADVILLGSTTMHQAGDYMARQPPVSGDQPGPGRHQARRDARPARAQALEGGVPGSAARAGREVLLARRRRRQDEGGVGMHPVLSPIAGADHHSVAGLEVDVAKVGGGRMKRLVYPVGYRWSTHMKPVAGTELCMHTHVGFLAQGSLAGRLRGRLLVRARGAGVRGHRRRSRRVGRGRGAGGLHPVRLRGGHRAAVRAARAP